MPKRVFVTGMSVPGLRHRNREAAGCVLREPAACAFFRTRFSGWFLRAGFSGQEFILMKAIVFHGVGDIALENVPEPKMARPTGPIVRITAGAICSADLHFVHGTFPGVKRVQAAATRRWAV
jgi:Alcohol dehydrogenase GroES-associated